VQSLPLLRTKLFIPDVPGQIVSRQHLISRLNNYISKKLILISAPAGFGKTTILCEWINQIEDSCAWFSIDKTDNDPVLFMSYVLTSFKEVLNEIDNDLFVKLNEPKPNLQEILIHLLNYISESAKNIVLVLDDYHSIKSNQIHELLEYFLNYQPKNLKLVISTRSDPILPIHKLRAGNLLIELRSHNLSFTPEEAEIYFNKVKELNLSIDDINNIYKRTEGWISGLHMASISLKNKVDTKQFIQTFAGDDRYIMDYLIEEVLNAQGPIIQDFLLKTSILERFTADLCKAVTEIDLLCGRSG